MSYFRGVLSGFAAIFVAAFVSIWPLLRGSRATGLAVLLVAPLSLRFWIVGILLFGLLFAASRASTILRLFFFWIPTVIVSAVGFAFFAMITYLVLSSRHQ